MLQNAIYEQNQQNHFPNKLRKITKFTFCNGRTATKGRHYTVIPTTAFELHQIYSQICNKRIQDPNFFALPYNSSSFLFIIDGLFSITFSLKCCCMHKQFRYTPNISTMALNLLMSISLIMRHFDTHTHVPKQGKYSQHLMLVPLS